MLRLVFAATLLVSAGAKPGCRGNKGWDGRDRRGPFRGPPGGRREDKPDRWPDRRQPTPLLNEAALRATQPLLDARAEKLWEMFKGEADERAKQEWAHGGINATSKLSRVFRLVTRAAQDASGDNATSAEVAASVWEALPGADREKHAEAWAAHKGDGVLQLALALAVMRAPGVNAEAAADAAHEKAKGWLAAAEMKGIYEADVQASAEAWKDEGEEAPATDEATRLLLGCMAVASRIEECEVQAEWARKCHECEQEHKMRHGSSDPLNGFPAWLIAAISVTAALALSTAVCLGCLVRSKLNRSAAMKHTEAPVWPESKMEAMAAAEKQAKLECVDGFKVNVKTDPESGYGA